MSPAPAELPLFPLQTVLFPDGLLELKVFEARYLDLIAACLRDSTGFGVVCLRHGSEVRQTDQEVEFESVGTRAELTAVDSAQAGILQVRCRGAERFRLGPSRQQPDGLWLAGWTPIEPDPLVAPPSHLEGVAQGLATRSPRSKARACGRFCRRIVSAMPAGSRTVGARCCRFRCRRNRS